MPDNSTGRIGEEYVADVLKRKGYKLLEKNFRCRYGEIDIIVRDDKFLVFVEVKTRECGSLVEPLEAVTLSKQRKIIKTAQYYLLNCKFDLQPRFDVAAVETKEKQIVSLNYLTDAFRVN